MTDQLGTVHLTGSHATIDLAGVTVEAQHVAQDVRTGMALRQLEEALPAGWEWAAGTRPASRPAIFYVVRAWSTDPLQDGPVTGTGDTLAEAADACRRGLAHLAGL